MDNQIEEEFERELLNTSILNDSREFPKEMHMGGDADNLMGHIFVEKKHPVPPYHEMPRDVVNLKYNLKAWREVLVFLKDIFLWEQEWYGECILVVYTIIFMLFYLSQPSTLTAISIIGIIIVLADYFVPVLSSTYFKEENWTDDKEEEFYEVCRFFIEQKIKIILAWKSYMFMRTTKPKMFYYGTIAALIFGTWLGCVINIYMLIYTTFACVVVYPGARRTGMIDRLTELFTDKLYALIESAKAKFINTNVSHDKTE